MTWRALLTRLYVAAKLGGKEIGGGGGGGGGSGGGSSDGGGGGGGGGGSPDASLPRALGHVEQGLGKGVLSDLPPISPRSLATKRGKGPMSDLKTPRSLGVSREDLSPRSMQPTPPSSPLRSASSFNSSHGLLSKGSPPPVPLFTGVSAWGSPVASADDAVAASSSWIKTGRSWTKLDATPGAVSSDRSLQAPAARSIGGGGGDSSGTGALTSSSDSSADAPSVGRFRLNPGRPRINCAVFLRLKLKYCEPLSNVAFNVNVCHYTPGAASVHGADGVAVAAAVDVTAPTERSPTAPPRWGQLKAATFKDGLKAERAVTSPWGITPWGLDLNELRLGGAC